MVRSAVYYFLRSHQNVSITFYQPSESVNDLSELEKQLAFMWREDLGQKEKITFQPHADFEKCVHTIFQEIKEETGSIASFHYTQK